MGRPSRYKPEYAKMLVEFYSVRAYEILVDKDGKVTEKANDMPFLVDFAKKIGTGTTTLHGWANKKDKNGNHVHPEFKDALKGFQEHRERILVTNGLKGLYNPSFAIFTAKNILGWRDKLEHSGDENNPVGMMLFCPKELPKEKNPNDTMEATPKTD